MNAGLLISGAGLVFLAVSVLLLRKQIRETHEWNRRRASQDCLGELVSGQFATLRTRIEHDWGCRIYDQNEAYDQRVAEMSSQDQAKLDFDLQGIANVFEIVAIGLKNHVFDEDIVYDYLGWFAVEYHRWLEGFIRKQRTVAEDVRVLQPFSEVAARWSARMAEERAQISNAAKVAPKPPL